MKTSTKTIPQEPASAAAEQPHPQVDHAATLAELGAKQSELQSFLEKAQFERTDLLVDGAPDVEVEEIDRTIGRAKQRLEAIGLQVADIQKRISVAERAKKAATFSALWPIYAEKLTKFANDVKSVHMAGEELKSLQGQMLGALGFVALDCFAGLNPDVPLNAQTIEDFEGRAQIALATGDARIGAEWPE